MYSWHQKKERISQVFSLQKEKNQDTEQWCSHLYITQQSATPEISSRLHTGEPWKHPRNTQHLKVMRNCSTNPNNVTLNETENISLGEITAYSSYQSPFISTNRISFSISKRKFQIKATSHIPVETCELHYTHVLQTPAISHSEMRFSNKSFPSILTGTGISKPKLLIKTLKDLFLKRKPETQP